MAGHQPPRGSIMRHPALAVLAAAGLAACAGESVTSTLAANDALRAGSPTAAGPPGSNGTVVVTEGDSSRQPENTPPARNWVLYNRLAGNGSFTTGPGSPPLGVGSVTFTTPTSADKVQLFNYDEVGTHLTEVR